MPLEIKRFRPIPRILPVSIGILLLFVFLTSGILLVNAATGPGLSIPDQILADPASSVVVPVTFTSNGYPISSMIFSIDYDESKLSFDPTDSNNDGIPDAVDFNVPVSFLPAALFDAADTDGEIDIVIADFSLPFATLPDSIVVSVTLTTLNVSVPAVAPVIFSQNPQASFGNNLGQSIPGTVDGGSVLIAEPCYALTLTHTGSGGDPIATPINSTNCAPGEYHAGEIIQLIASPDSGWDVGGWSGTINNTSTANTNSLTMPANDHTASVFYVLEPPPCYKLFRTHTGSGSDPVASPTSSTGCPSGEYLQSEVIQLTAYPSSGWVVDSWNGTSNDFTNASTNSLTMPASDHTVTVNYVESPPVTCYILYRTHTGLGGDPVASPANSTGCPTGQFHAGENILLTASPAQGWDVGGWSGTNNDASIANVNSLAMPASTHTVTVDYVEETPPCFKLGRTHTGLGSDPAASPQSSSGCPSGEYLGGEVIQLTASPSSGWEVDSWTGTNNDASTSTSNTLTMPASDHNVTVNYIEVPPVTCYVLSRTHTGLGADPSSIPAGSSGCPTGQYHAGENIQLTANPDAGWKVGSWTGTDNNASTADSNSLTMPASNHTVAVNYVVDTTLCYTLVRTHTGSGADPSVLPSGSSGCPAGEYHPGQVIQLTASPDSGWIVSGWSGTDNDSSLSVSNQVTMPASDLTVVVHYILNSQACYTLTRSHTGSGTNPAASPQNSTGCPSGQYHAGENIQFSAGPALGWVVDSWTGTNNDSSKLVVNSLTMPASDHTVVVHYVSQPSACFILTRTHTGQGDDPIASPTNSTTCPIGQYKAGETIQLTASPAFSWVIVGWSGTNNDSSTSSSNSLTMPASNHTVTVHYDQPIIFIPIILNIHAPANQSPFTPSAPSPGIGASNQELSLSLSWTGGDPDGDPVTYDVYLEAGDSTPDNLVCSAVSNLSCSTGSLNPLTQYYWKVVARDQKGLETSSPVWNFKTKSAPATCSNLVVNSGFEANTGWTIPATDYTASYSTSQSHTGSRSMRVGIISTNDNVFSFSSFRQRVFIPSDSPNATLKFWLWMKSTETTASGLMSDQSKIEEVESTLASDSQLVLVLDSMTGDVLKSLVDVRTDKRSWTLYQFDLKPYSGKFLELYFGVTNDGIGGVTGMYVDDVSLEVCQ